MSIRKQKDLKTVRLSAKEIGDVLAFDLNRFVFNFGGKKYLCGRIQACLASRKVCRLLSHDSSVNELFISVEDHGNHFEDVVSLMNGESVEITRENAFFLESFARELDNEELLSSVLESQMSDRIDSSNVIDRIVLKRRHQTDCREELDFIAKHFHEMDVSSLRQLSCYELEEVLGRKELLLKNENDLFDLIDNLSRSDKQYSFLFRFIEPGSLDPGHLNSFLDRIFPDLLCPSVWKGLCYCLRHTEARYAETRDSSDVLFTDEQGPFNGIIHRLSETCRRDESCQNQEEWNENRSNRRSWIGETA